jgi:hypothetical protein
MSTHILNKTDYCIILRISFYVHVNTMYYHEKLWYLIHQNDLKLVITYLIHYIPQSLTLLVV